MKHLLTSPRFIIITIAVLALIILPITLVEVQNFQNARQNAESIMWLTNQSASSACATDGTGAIISATFTNTELPSSSTEMNVTVKDNQTGKTADLGSIQGGDTRTGTIQTGKSSLQAGTVTFNLSWTNGQSGTDTRTANYYAVSQCIAPTPTPTITTTPTPVPSGQPTPTPTICPTLAPVKNVKIICPNCQLNQK